MVRPHLEYAQAVWSPYYGKEICRIENVQRRASKKIPGLSNLNYKERLEKLNLPCLVYRRLRGDMIECYKITQGLYDPRASTFVIYREDVVAQNRVTRGHNKKIYIKKSNKVTRRNYFTNRICDTWNNLPQLVVEADNVNTFKRRLDDLWKKEEMVYDFKKIYNKLKSNYNTELTEDFSS